MTFYQTTSLVLSCRVSSCIVGVEPPAIDFVCLLAREELLIIPHLVQSFRASLSGSCTFFGFRILLSLSGETTRVGW